MVGLWSPDPPPEPENLEENYPDYVVVVGPSDEEHSEEGYEGYEPLSDLGDMSDEFNDVDDGDEENEVEDVKELEPTTVNASVSDSETQDVDNSEEEPGCSYRQLELSDLTVSYIKSAMANIILPASATPPWANRIPEEEWIQFLCARVKLLQVKNQRVNDSDSSESEG